MSDTSASSINTITAGTSITGDIAANGDFRLDGVLQGNIVLTGKLVVGEKGSVKGNVQVNEFLTLYASSSILGDIVTGKLSIEPGAHFSGRCTMNNDK